MTGIFARTTQHSPAALAWATAYRNAAAITGGLLENGCVARVGWHLTAVVCSRYGLGHPVARLLSAVDVSTCSQHPVAAGASWNIHCRPPAPPKGVLSDMLDFLVVLD